MAPPSEDAGNRQGVSPEDGLGQLIRWSMHHSVSEAEPPTDSWSRILDRVRQMPVPSRSRRLLKGSSFPVTAFVQAVVVSALLVAFGLGLDHGVVMPQREQSKQATPTIAVRAGPPASEAPWDVLRGYVLAQMERGRRQRLGGEMRDASIPS